MQSGLREAYAEWSRRDLEQGVWGLGSPEGKEERMGGERYTMALLFFLFASYFFTINTLFFIFFLFYVKLVILYEGKVNGKK